MLGHKEENPRRCRAPCRSAHAVGLKTRTGLVTAAGAGDIPAKKEGGRPWLSHSRSSRNFALVSMADPEGKGPSPEVASQG